MDRSLTIIPSLQPDNPWLAVVCMSRGRKRTIISLALKSPEEQRVVGVSSPIDGYVARKAARQREPRKIREGRLNFKV